MSISRVTLQANPGAQLQWEFSWAWEKEKQKKIYFTLEALEQGDILANFEFWMNLRLTIVSQAEYFGKLEQA